MTTTNWVANWHDKQLPVSRQEKLPLRSQTNTLSKCALIVFQYRLIILCSIVIFIVVTNLASRAIIATWIEILYHDNNSKKMYFGTLDTVTYLLFIWIFFLLKRCYHFLFTNPGSSTSTGIFSIYRTNIISEEGRHPTSYVTWTPEGAGEAFELGSK